ncbi:unnamed protein product, partial [Rotaria magnacalcarata]
MWGECRQKKHFEPFFVAYENRRLVIDQDAFDHHVTFIVHRLINSSSTSLPASSTIDHQADTPPPRARRSFWQYFRCTVVTIFVSQTGILLSILAADYGSFFSASSTSTLVWKNVLFCETRSERSVEVYI